MLLKKTATYNADYPVGKINNTKDSGPGHGGGGGGGGEEKKKEKEKRCRCQCKNDNHHPGKKT